MRKILLLLSIVGAIAFYSCTDNLVNSLIANKAPTTHLFLYPDSSISNQQSKVKLHWWADDPDGLVIGYYITWDGSHWTFTTKNDSTIAFPISGSDTVYNFKVAGVDNHGNGVYDKDHTANGIDFGAEPFTDADHNGAWSSGESFIDIGNIDPNPASVKLPLSNTAPQIVFLQDKTGQTIEFPDTTFTVASLGWDATDLDGDETIQNIYIALNDTSQKIAIPGSTRFITIKAVPPFNSDVVSCDVYLGASIKEPYAVKLPNLKLNAKNTLYIYAVDIANAKSSLMQMPDQSKTWYVKKPKGDILIIDDHGTADNAASYYSQIFDGMNLAGRYDVLDIKSTKAGSSSPTLLPKYISPMLTETMKLFKYVFWYSGDNNPTLDAAQTVTKAYTDAGGKILFSMTFARSFDQSGLTDFLPIDGMSSSYISIVLPNTAVNATAKASALGYNNLTRDNGSSPVAVIWSFNINSSSLTATSLYTLATTGSPVVGFKSASGNLVFMGLPLNRLDGGSANVKSFFQKVFFGEFGVTQ